MATERNTMPVACGSDRPPLTTTGTPKVADGASASDLLSASGAQIGG